MEVWKDIPGYEGLYQVSNLGNIKSIKKDKILKPGKVGNYLHIHLSKNGKTCWMMIHRLVAKTFVDNKNNYNIVNHLDNNPLNNCASNLEWTTYKGNMQYASKQGRMKYNPNNLKKAQESRKKPIIAHNNKEEIYFESMSEAVSKGFNAWHIADCCNKKYGCKTHKGYDWRWA